MEPVQRPQLVRNRQIRRDQITRRTISSRSITEYDKWVEGIKSSGDQFGKHPSPGAWSSRIITNSKSMPCDRDEEFQLHDKRENPDVDRAGSPVLWKKSLADQRSYMLHDNENAHPATRTQKVSDYRKEMMEMVRGLPEEDFELTLQDIVEKRKESKREEPVIVKEPKHDEDKETTRKKHQKKCESVIRSNSIDTGLLSRMFLPLSVAVRRRSLTLRRRGEKVTTKEVEPRKKATERNKSKDEEWWRKNEFSEKGSSNSSSVGSSSSNGSNSSGDDHFSRNMSMRQTKCYCFKPGKSKPKSR